MTESDTRRTLIDPALAAAGWGVVPGSRVRREHPITLGRLEGQGRRARPLAADYVLEYRNTNLGVVEAKAHGEPVTLGVAQAKHYAGKLAVRFAYATNGHGIYRIDMHDGTEGDVPRFPTPDELWEHTFATPNAWRDRFAAVPFHDKGGTFVTRYYQGIAIQRVLERVAAGDRRILLTLATGTGKTSIAAQIAWKLFASRWNLGGAPTRQPRILFLADRNTLADQAFRDFVGVFPDDAMVRIAPDEIRKNRGRVPTNGSLFFTIFQTFLSGPNHSPCFGAYPADFFDFIIIDECHRGGANDESTWRGILDHFAPAVQLGLTATPKRRDNVDTYAYFGEPVYTYSLKDGINDGFLTPFRVRQVSTTLDEYVYTSDDRLIEGEPEEGRRYVEADFNRIIEIKEREAHRVRLFLGMIDPRDKTLVFCATQDHALAVRDLINQMKAGKDPNYCHRVTADDGDLGEQHLRDFQDNERSVPTVLTTSQKLSTGVDARNVRNIVLMRPVNSMIEFKQIVGRGTRLFDGKDYFTIIDFVKAYRHFSDPEWDGEPIDNTTQDEKDEPPADEAAEAEAGPDEGSSPRPRPARVKVRLADGKERHIQHMVTTSFWHADGRPMSVQQFMELLFGAMPAFAKDEAELRAKWGEPGTRAALLQGLAERGFKGEQLAEMQRLLDAEASDLFDVLANIAFALPTHTREERAADARAALAGEVAGARREFVEYVLSQYVRGGVQELDKKNLPPLVKLRYGSIPDAVPHLGEPAEIIRLFAGFQRHLYAR